VKQKRNREKLMEQSLYDLLVNMNETMKRLQDAGHRVCVLDALKVERGYCKHCITGIECKDCIAKWMNDEFPF
jgi:hypothetical protein